MGACERLSSQPCRQLRQRHCEGCAAIKAPQCAEQHPYDALLGLVAEELVRKGVKLEQGVFAVLCGKRSRGFAHIHQQSLQLLAAQGATTLLGANVVRRRSVC